MHKSTLHLIGASTLTAFASGAQESVTDSAAVDPTAGITFRATLGAEAIAVGPTLTATVTIELAEGVSATDSGIPGFILQLDPPQGLELSGKRITEYKQLSRNEFLMEPWERLVKETSVEVQFALTEMPAKDATLGLILVGYVAREPGKDDAFLRRRLELPLVAEGTARKGDALDSSWGPDKARLTIGDKAPSFELPVLQGGEIELAHELDAGPMLLTTYRAHW